MPITPVWLDEEKTVLQLNYELPVESWDIYDLALNRAFEMAKTVDHSITLIHNTGTVPMPKGNAFLHLREAAKLRPVNVKTTITVIINPFARSIVSAASRFIDFGPFKLVGSLEQAYQVSQYNKTLNQG